MQNQHTEIIYISTLIIKYLRNKFLKIPFTIASKSNRIVSNKFNQADGRYIPWKLWHGWKKLKQDKIKRWSMNTGSNFNIVKMSILPPNHL